jgi:hypothetical protein
MDTAETTGSPEATLAGNRRGVAEMLGEFLREASVLLAVFIPLDLSLQGHQLTVGWATAIVVLPAALLASGITLERVRRR